MHSPVPVRPFLLILRFDNLVSKMLASSDLPTLALEEADSFDYHFMSYLMQRLQASQDEAEIAALNKVGEAVNFAMQQRLAKADFILRGILKSGDLKVCGREGGREGRREGGRDALTKVGEARSILSCNSGWPKLILFSEGS